MVGRATLWVALAALAIFFSQWHHALEEMSSMINSCKGSTSNPSMPCAHYGSCSAPLSVFSSSLTHFTSSILSRRR